MRSTLFLLLLSILCFPQLADAYSERNLLQKEVSLEDLKNVLVNNQNWVKYPTYSDREGWNNFTGDQKQEIIATGEKYLDYTWQVVKATDYIEYERSGSRDIMQNPFGANNNALSSLVLAELAEGEGRFIDQIINGVWLSCEMSSWVLSAHLPAYHSSKRSLADPDEQVIDLTAGDLGSFLSWTYYFLKDEMDKVNPVVSSRLRKELQRRILDPYMERSDFWWQAFNATPETMVNNWNPWCNFNVLATYLLLEDDTDKLAEAVYRTMVSVDKFINYNNDDGACEEGPSYWGHAAGKLYDYLQILYYATDGKVSLFDEPMIKNMGEYICRSYIGDGWVVNFADASAKGGGDKGVIFRYGAAVNSDEMKQFAAYLHERNPKYNLSGRDIFRNLESLAFHDNLKEVQPALSNAKYSWYPQTEFAYMRNDDGFFFAAKGGYNNESHNHNDVGTFVLYYDNDPVFIDIGVGTYTRQTFSSERYSIWTMQTNYHNLPLINGQPQEYGSQYRSADVKFDERRQRFSLDIAGAYKNETAVKSWVRSYTMHPKGELIIEDSYTLEDVIGNNAVVFMSHNKPTITKPGAVSLDVGGRKIQLSFDSKRFEPAIEAIEQTDPRLSNVWGDSVYRIILKDNTNSKKGKYKFTVKAI
ncbi:MAG TPA: heparinase II/III-family protein [Mariniphaga sp.]|nr:heparinase II/III-family protein [Mariniphaga sp.]